MKSPIGASLEKRDEKRTITDIGIGPMVGMEKNNALFATTELEQVLLVRRPRIIEWI